MASMVLRRTGTTALPVYRLHPIGVLLENTVLTKLLPMSPPTLHLVLRFLVAGLEVAKLRFALPHDGNTTNALPGTSAPALIGTPKLPSILRLAHSMLTTCMLVRL